MYANVEELELVLKKSEITLISDSPVTYKKCRQKINQINYNLMELGKILNSYNCPSKIK